MCIRRRRISNSAIAAKDPVTLNLVVELTRLMLTAQVLQDCIRPSCINAAVVKEAEHTALSLDAQRHHVVSTGG